MNAQRLAAVFAYPLFVFLRNKLPYPVLLDKGEVFNHAHAVPGSVAFVQLPEPRARELLADVAKPRAALIPQSAIHDTALCATPRLACFSAVAPGARILLPQVSKAYPAVHSAWSDEFCSCHSIFSP
ncbi:MAG: hypothetical protein A2293_01210 [Elusimicrobia bacterium RIFOXYB2_FULL_49_7]|nr:MAG: hypothetical protein A2293_01210 [Elusimicrobia bacterium RIFOXYB2_FULL_49_7]